MATKGDSLVRLERKDQRPTIHRKVWTNGQDRQKILGCFLSGFTGMESHPEYSFLRKTDNVQERLFSRSRYRGSTIGLARDAGFGYFSW